MANVNQTIQRPIVMSSNGAVPRVGWFGKDGGATWSPGDILKLGSGTGTLLKAVAGDALLVGMALSVNPYLTRTDIVVYPVAIFDRDTILIMSAWATNTVTDAGNHLTQAMIGTSYDLAIAGAPNSAFYVVDIGATTDAILTIEGVYGGGGGEVTDHYARVYVRPKVAACALAL